MKDLLFFAFLEIVEKVGGGGSIPPLRPTLNIDDCDAELLTMLRKCWSDDVNERPDFTQIKHFIRKLNK